MKLIIEADNACEIIDLLERLKIENRDAVCDPNQIGIKSELARSVLNSEKINQAFSPPG
jgi:hypothetical protein